MLDYANAQDHDVTVDYYPDSPIHAVVVWEPISDGGDYTAEVLGVFFDEWVRETPALREDALWAFWLDWRDGRVKLIV